MGLPHEVYFSFASLLARIANKANEFGSFPRKIQPRHFV
jgi:hypothetical protein